MTYYGESLTNKIYDLVLLKQQMDYIQREMVRRIPVEQEDMLEELNRCIRKDATQQKD